MRGARDARVNLPPPRASHRSGLRQSRRVNYTHTTVDHTKSNSKARTKSNHTNTNSKRRSTPKTKHEYIDDYVINNSKRNNKHVLRHALAYVHLLSLTLLFGKRLFLVKKEIISINLLVHSHNNHRRYFTRKTLYYSEDRVTQTYTSS